MLLELDIELRRPCFYKHFRVFNLFAYFIGYFNLLRLLNIIFKLLNEIINYRRTQYCLLSAGGKRVG